MDGASDNGEKVVESSSSPIRAKIKLHTGAGTPGDKKCPSCFCVRYSPDDRFVAVSYADGSINVYRSDDGSLEAALASTQAANSAVAVQLRWSPKSKRLMSVTACADSDGQVNQWDINSGRSVHSFSERDNQILCTDFTPDGHKFATAGYDRQVRVYHENTKQQECILSRGNGMTTTGHSNVIFSLKFHPNAHNIIFTGGWDNTVQIWDTRQKKSFRSLSHIFINGDTLDYDAGRDCLLTGSYRTKDALQIWDFNTGKLVESVQDSLGSASMLFSAQFSKDPDCSMIAAGGFQAHEAKFYHRNGDGAQAFAGLVDLERPVFSVDFAHDSSSVAVGGADGAVRIVDLNTKGRFGG